MTVFVNNPLVPLDNNGTERAIRGPVVGRKNHYGSKSKRGTEVAAVKIALNDDAGHRDARRSSGGPSQVADCDQIAIRNRRNITLTKRHKSLRLSGCKNELDIKTIGRMNINHRTKVSAAQPVLR